VITKGRNGTGERNAFANTGWASRIDKLEEKPIARVNE